MHITFAYPNLFKIQRYKGDTHFRFAHQGLSDELDELLGDMTFTDMHEYFFKSYTKVIYSTPYGARMTLRINADTNDTRLGYLMIPTDKLSDASCMVLYNYGLVIYMADNDGIDKKYDRTAIERRMAINNIIEH